jgi:hypothetical protein
MNVTQVFDLKDWVLTQRAWIMSEENPTLKMIRQRAEASLAFKCTESNIKECLIQCKIPVKRSKAEAKLIRLQEENERMKQLVLKIASYTNLPAAIAREVANDFDLNAEIADALKVNRKIA